MGGFNSGSPRRSHRLRSEQLHRISLSEIARTIDLRAVAHHVGPCGPETSEVEIVAVPGAGHGVRRHVGYRTTHWLIDDGRGLPAALWTSIDSMFVALTQTPGRYGGTRLWFVCPWSSCGRKCTVLYREKRTNARAFTCRRCLRFRYATQLLGDSDRLSIRIDRLVSRLGVAPDGTLRRPKGMHEKTFRRISADATRAIAVWKRTNPIYRTLTASLEDIERRAHHEFAQLIRGNNGRPAGIRSQP